MGRKIRPPAFTKTSLPSVKDRRPIDGVASHAMLHGTHAPRSTRADLLQTAVRFCAAGLRMADVAARMANSHGCQHQWAVKYVENHWGVIQGLARDIHSSDTSPDVPIQYSAWDGAPETLEHAILSTVLSSPGIRSESLAKFLSGDRDLRVRNEIQKAIDDLIAAGELKYKGFAMKLSIPSSHGSKSRK